MGKYLVPSHDPQIFISVAFTLSQQVHIAVWKFTMTTVAVTYVFFMPLTFRLCGLLGTLQETVQSAEIMFLT